MKNISYLLSLLLAFSYVSFADEEVKEAPKESEEVAEEVTEESSGEEAEEDKEPTISEFIEEGDFEVIEGMLDIYYETEEDMKNDGICLVNLENSDVMRSRLVSTILDIYNQ